ncbi:hypothetical protein [Cupriavidus necator]|uniref:hypothetical protein n=1 Tax=Cupriavidus necator TaxID=106590 RepID=UPI001F21C5DF|nr:hypothetical protein [Cupriavidus necator]
MITVGKDCAGLATSSGDGIDGCQRIKDIARNNIIRVGGQPYASEVSAMGIGAISQHDHG